MKILGLDYGDASLGIAISDKEKTLARGLENYRFETDKTEMAVAKVLAILEVEPVEAIVLGLPKNMDGSLGNQAQKTLRFKETLEKKLTIPVIAIDERLTSRMAQQTMIFSKKNRKKRKQTLDQMSAVIILQNYLDQKK